MMTIIAFYWPALLAALVIGIVSGVTAFRSALWNHGVKMTS